MNFSLILFFIAAFLLNILSLYLILYELPKEKKMTTQKEIENWDKLQKHNSTKVVAIDFDGVIHKNSKGYHDGTIYDDPVPNAIESIKKLSEHFEIVIYSFKGHPDRPKMGGKDGNQLVWDWLEEYGIKDCVKDVVWGKPNAIVYIDDKGYRFENWDDTIEFVMKTFGNG